MAKKKQQAKADGEDTALDVESLARPQGQTSPEPETETEERFERRWTKKETRSSQTSGQTIEVPTDGGSELDKERSRANELYERLQRSMADLSNYRKRSEQEREEMAKFASMLLVAELLPVLDNFERALATIPNELEQFTWLQGVALIERHLRAILERQGVQAIEAVNQQFNPSLHEAIVEEETTKAEPGVVIGELQRGYTMHGRVLRPTLAKVSKAVPAADDRGQEGAGTVKETAGKTAEESTA